MATSDDLSAILLEQHKLISVKLDAVATSYGAERDAIFEHYSQVTIRADRIQAV